MVDHRKQNNTTQYRTQVLNQLRLIHVNAICDLNGSLLTSVKTDNFLIEKLRNYFLMFAQNINCGYT